MNKKSIAPAMIILIAGFIFTGANTAMAQEEVEIYRPHNGIFNRTTPIQKIQKAIKAESYIIKMAAIIEKISNQQNKENGKIDIKMLKTKNGQEIEITSSDPQKVKLIQKYYSGISKISGKFDIISISVLNNGIMLEITKPGKNNDDAFDVYDPDDPSRPTNANASLSYL